MTTTKKTNEPILAGSDILETINRISSLNSDEAITELLGKLTAAYEKNREMCDRLINSNDQLIDFLSCEDWEAFTKVKGCYKTGADWHKIRDEYKRTLKALKSSTRRLNAAASSNNSQTN